MPSSVLEVFAVVLAGQFRVQPVGKNLDGGRSGNWKKGRNSENE
jgi:hypothetical protein